jgi:hypothetical protein
VRVPDDFATHRVDRILRDVAGAVGDALEAIEHAEEREARGEIGLVAIDVRQLVEEIVVQRVHGSFLIERPLRALEVLFEERGGRFLDHRDCQGPHLEHAVGGRELLDRDQSDRASGDRVRVVAHPFELGVHLGCRDHEPQLPRDRHVPDEELLAETVDVPLEYVDPVVAEDDAVGEPTIAGLERLDGILQRADDQPRHLLELVADLLEIPRDDFFEEGGRHGAAFYWRSMAGRWRTTHVGVSPPVIGYGRK